MRRQFLLILGLILLLATAVAGCIQSPMHTTEDKNVTENEYRTVVDSRGVEVKVPVNIERVVTVSDGLVEEMMVVLGVKDTLVGLGSKGLQYEGDFSYPADNGSNVTVSGGKHVALTLSPDLKNLPLVTDYGVAMNYETLASVKPDIVIIRLGDSAFPAGEDNNAQKTIQTIESLGIPLIVLYSPNCYENSSPTAISDEIHIIGEVFGKEEEADRIASKLESRQEMIRERTQNISDEEKPDVLVLGLSPMHRTQTSAGIAWGLKTTESYMIEDVVNAKNAFRSDLGSFEVVSAEKVLAMDPDVIVIGTAAHYAPPEELYEASYYKNLRELQAVKNHRVVSLPYTPRNSAKRLEYPIDLMVIAKAAYPEKFEDIDLNEWILSFYQDVYGVDRDTAIQLRSAQLMDWGVET
ncbi:ABC transporter substrate-binding protein [Methanosarcina sp. 2.H.T.1A.6]|uniref:iron ABC transporter substrate-binding protein n=1 Tax=unclassified Methanosarcina TaxID=2644672 RepID=UPI000621F1C0|nr:MULTISPECIES: iron ABC transporter substrate-binding protein [unclassified Methanosarcina]KKG14672.1 ABC transporter substrate-binding protein [Methanosarcina sp. 2.H.T.1A.3]KKG22178.1 ABC transporter substrate-binding protein [Methanosarcina sp. 2.H.T.1A.8]KKG24540.1 ABC transporter substrate-binding protein [Methanosarcina sp. 2.H.T.1A.6]